MDFFEHQDAARRNTTRLVVLFVLAVVSIIALVYIVMAGAFVLSGEYDAARSMSHAPTPARLLWDPMLLLYVGAGTVLVVGLSSAYKIASLSGGGHVVAESLGGALIHPDSTDPNERKLLNVVEEMAIASGTPVPPVYLLDDDAINAFAAGYSKDDAVIGVTRGAIRALSRDELQGVIAHEFSHILNGDMRLNIRLMGIVFGILVIGLIGQMLLRAAIYSGHGRRARRSSGKDNNPLPLIAIGLALIIVGYVGVFFGNLIKAAVSRQREFLADAAAVQFTRNPDGIAGALKAIGGWTSGSKVSAPNAAEISHMFFSQALTSWLGGALATHPPLVERIKRIDPSFDGGFPAVRAATPESPADTARGFAAASSATSSAGKPAAPDLLAVIDQIGAPGPDHIENARRIIAGLPDSLRQAAKDPFAARALVYALMISPDQAVQERQFNRISTQLDRPTLLETRKLLAPLREMRRDSRLPLIDLALPALRAMSVSQHHAFRETVTALVRADNRVTLFEWMLEHILTRHVTTHFDKPRRTPSHFYKLKPVLPQAGALLSTLAWAGHTDPAAARAAYNAAVSRLETDDPPQMSPRDQAGLSELNELLDTLDRLVPRMKKQLLLACASCIGHDRTVTATEAELFRALADALDCPTPPIPAN